MNVDPETMEPYPEPNERDYATEILKIGISAIPIFGGPASELFGALLAPALGRRRDDWFEQLRLRLNDLTRRVDGLTFEKLSKNEEFVSAVMQASLVASRTHSSEKLIALQSAVLNVAAGTAPDDDLQSMFLSLVDLLTPLHLRLLKQFKLRENVRIIDAPSWMKADACSQAAKELLDRGLIGAPRRLLVPDRDQLIIGGNGTYTFNAAQTALGRDFLSFITFPRIDE